MENDRRETRSDGLGKRGERWGIGRGGARAYAVKTQSFPLNTASLALHIHPHVRDVLLTNQTDSELFSYIR